MPTALRDEQGVAVGQNYFSRMRKHCTLTTYWYDHFGQIFCPNFVQLKPKEFGFLSISRFLAPYYKALIYRLLTIYDMCKAVDRGMRIEEICLLEKKGGKSGHWVRKARA